MADRVLQWNVRGLRARQPELLVLMKELDPSCLCLQELKLSNNTQISVGNLYKTYMKLPDTDNNEEMPKGGSLIAVKTSISHHHIQLNSTLQAVAISFTHGKLKSLCSIYIPPNDRITDDQLQELIDQLPKPTLIMGDFNTHNPLWYDHRIDQRGEKIQNLIEKEDLMVLNEDYPTYFRPHDQASSTIDLALISNTCSLEFGWSVQNDLNGSDHYPIMVSAHQPSPPNRTEKWDLKKADWSKFKKLAVTTTEVAQMPDIDKAYKHIKDTILTASTSSIPKTKVCQTKRPCLPWWTPECKSERTKVRSAFKIMKRNPNPTTIKTYKRRQAIKVRTYRQAKATSWKNYVSKLNAKTPTSQIWQKIRKINGKYTPKPYPNLRIDQKIITSPNEVANAFAEYYASISTAKHQHRIPQKINQNVNNGNADINLDFTMRELEESIRQLEEGKSTGEDQIENTMIKQLPPISRKYLMDLLNKMWNEGTFPQEWKTSIILPILKTGKEQTDLKNYRPISLTSCICKLYERMVNNRLMWFLEKTKQLSPRQYGFRQNKTTIDPIGALTTDILNGFKDKKTTTAVFFDFEKAFDTISRQTILSNLMNMGVHGQMLQFIHNYLKDRSIKVKIGNTLSDSHTITAGVPQGGVLSATCFLVAINTILETLPKDIKGSLYADDLIIYHASRRLQTSTRLIQNSINKLQDWAQTVGLKFSPTKTEVVHFWRNIRGGANQTYPTLRLYNQEIPQKNTTKFLGMILDRGLNWESHILALKGETMRALNILKIVSRKNYGPDRKTLLRLYWAICRSKLEYGSQLYSSAGPTTLQKLNPVHNEAMRLCTGAFRTSPAASLHVEAGSPPLDLQRDELCLRYITRLESLPEYLKNLNILDQQYDDKYEPNNQSFVPIGTRARRLKQSLDFDPDPAQNTVPEAPPWLLKTVDICNEGATSAKRYSSIPKLKQNFLSHMSKHLNTKHIYTDGSKSDDGVGFGVIHGQQLQYRARGTLPKEASVFSAELHAIIKALTIIENSEHLNWTIFSDSQASLQAIAQLNPKHPLVKTIQASLSTQQNQRKHITFCKVPSHVGIHGNEAADKAAIDGQKLPGLNTTKVPHRDYHLPIKRNIMKQWQLRWDHIDDNVPNGNQGNKLRNIKPFVKPWPSIPGGNRRYEVKITRLRIGHTRLTHGHFGGRPPECTFCRMSPLTAKHFLIDCQTTQPIRNQLKLPSNLKKLLGEQCPVLPLINYLQEIQVLDEI